MNIGMSPGRPIPLSVAAILPHPGFTTRWFPLGRTFDFTNDPAINPTTSGQLRAQPFVLGRDAVLAELGINVTVLQAAGKITVGVYDSDPVTLQPRNLMAQAAEFTTDAAGIKTGAAVAVLKAGLYYAVGLWNVSGGVLRVQGHFDSASLAHPMFGRSSIGVSVALHYLTANLAYTATLPSVFPAVTGNNNGDNIDICARFSA